MKPGSNTDSRELFSGKSSSYSRFRPGYPRSLITRLEDMIGMNPLTVVADIGSGTGILSRLFIENGNIVYGVEPNDEMRQLSATSLRAFPEFHAVSGTGEKTGLPGHSIDLVVCGQAFHWLNPDAAREEFRRILVEDGKVALMWNDRVQDENSFNSEYEVICKKYSPKYHSSGSTVMSTDVFGKFFKGSYATLELDNYQELSMEGVLGRYLSASYSIGSGHPDYENLVSSLELAFKKYQNNEKVRLKYTTRVFLGSV